MEATRKYPMSYTDVCQEATGYPQEHTIQVFIGGEHVGSVVRKVSYSCNNPRRASAVVRLSAGEHLVLGLIQPQPRQDQTRYDSPRVFLAEGHKVPQGLVPPGVTVTDVDPDAPRDESRAHGNKVQAVTYKDKTFTVEHGFRERGQNGRLYTGWLICSDNAASNKAICAYTMSAHRDSSSIGIYRSIEEALKACVEISERYDARQKETVND